MPTGYESMVVNGQLVPVAPRAAFNPIVWGPAYSGPGMWPRQGVYNVPPVLPSPEMMAAQPPASYGATGTYPFPTNASHTGNPFHLTKSPVWWVLGGLVFTLFMLHAVHYKG